MNRRSNSAEPASTSQLDEITTTSPSTTDYDIPWRSYSESERLHILAVLRRDVEIKRNELERIRWASLLHFWFIGKDRPSLVLSTDNLIIRHLLCQSAHLIHSSSVRLSVSLAWFISLSVRSSRPCFFDYGTGGDESNSYTTKRWRKNTRNESESLEENRTDSVIDSTTGRDHTKRSQAGPRMVRTNHFFKGK